jgi:hypothetical protein
MGNQPGNQPGNQKVSYSIAQGLDIEFATPEDCLVFSAMMATYDIFAPIYESLIGVPCSLEIYALYRADNRKEDYKRILKTTKLSNRLPLWKAMMNLGRRK